MGGSCSTYGEEKCTKGFWWGDVREGNYLEELGADGSVTAKWIFKKWDGVALTGLLWLRIGTGGGRL